MARLAVMMCGLVLLSGAARAQLKETPPFPAELVRFAANQTAAVFAGAEGQWDARIRERGWILREGGVWKLWYTGYDGVRGNICRLGYATSSDGKAWVRHPRNPLLEDLWIEDMMVVRHEGVYLMFAEGRGDRAHWLVSEDGIDWVPRGQLDVRRASGEPISEGAFGTPTVFRKQGRWHLFYERSDLGVWLATSHDLKVWTNVQDDPVLMPGPAEYEKDLIALNQIIEHQGRYYASYHGSTKTGPSQGLWSTCAAVSDDLIHWEKYAMNPLLPSAANQSSGILVHDGREYRLYTMHPEVHLHLRRR
jgi:hypothetical protein